MILQIPIFSTARIRVQKNADSIATVYRKRCQTEPYAHWTNRPYVQRTNSFHFTHTNTAHIRNGKQQTSRNAQHAKKVNKCVVTKIQSSLRKKMHIRAAFPVFWPFSAYLNSGKRVPIISQPSWGIITTHTARTTNINNNNKHRHGLVDGDAEGKPVAQRGGASGSSQNTSKSY